MDKYYYELVVSILDKDGNRRESISITGSNNKETIIKEREKLRLEIAEENMTSMQTNLTKSLLQILKSAMMKQTICCGLNRQ